MKHLAPISSFIDGNEEFVGGDCRQLIRSFDNTPIGMLLEAGGAGVTKAVKAAKGAAATHGHTTYFRRSELLTNAANALETATDEIAALIANDIGKPIRIAKVEVRRGVEFLRGCASLLPHLNDESLPLDAAQAGAGCIGFVRRVPYGIVAAITPFNAPVNLLLQKVAPAVAAGNAVVVKPAPAGTRTAVRLAQLFTGAGWPRGLFNVIGGDKETAAALVQDKDIRAVSFTGSTGGGDALARLAGAKKFVAELGSNAANIVFADADIATAAKKIASAGFEASGQQCISAQRVLVERKCLDAFLPLFVAATEALKVGAPDDLTTDVGPMIDERSAIRAEAMFEEAISSGGQAILRPVRTGATLSPGIVAHIPRPARLWCEEVFGPIVVVVPFDTVDEALTLANDSNFGLQGGVFTNNLATTMRFVRHFDVGSLWINEASRFRLDMYPFGGVKDSGVGREGLRYAIDEMSQLKFIGINA